MKILTKAFNFVLLTSKYYNIDESHGISHSMDVLNYAKKIYSSEKEKFDYLDKYKNIIYISAIVHDMCDKKYMNEDEGFIRINEHFNNDFTNSELKDIKKIVTTMSYSTVKKNGFPKYLNELEIPYHIVRESDLLSAYNFDRCMIYKMHKSNYSIYEAFNDAKELFNERVFKHNDDNLFITNTGKLMSNQLHLEAQIRINNWYEILYKK